MGIDKKKINIVIGIIIVLILTILFSIPLIRFINKPDELRDYLESFGILAPLMFILLTMIQIIIPFIPGEPFELLAGYSFGFIKGSLFCLIAGSIASIIIILLVKKYGRKLITSFFKEEQINKLSFLNSKKSFVIFAILFILPGTPKDLLCYIGGLNNYDFVPLVLITTIGRIPSIISSTYPGNAINEKDYGLAIIIYAITIVISLSSAYFYDKITNRNN